jgi:hypothetical protein
MIDPRRAVEEAAIKLGSKRARLEGDLAKTIKDAVG